jgi:hypothetical protein
LLTGVRNARAKVSAALGRNNRKLPFDALRHGYRRPLHPYGIDALLGCKGKWSI